MPTRNLRDLRKVKPGRLVEETDQIKDKFDPRTWETIDALHKAGNTGAQMEKDINMAADVEPDKTILLIELIEALLKKFHRQGSNSLETLRE